MPSRVAVIHRNRIKLIEEEAASLAQTSAKIAACAKEVLEQGGQLHIQPQVAFVTGCLARIMKDWGVVEQLQSEESVTQKKTLDVRSI